MMANRPLLALATSVAFIGVPAQLGDVGQVVGCAHQIKTAQDESAECQRLATVPVAVEEEYALGGAVAVRLVGAQGLILDDNANSAKRRLARYVNLVGRHLGAESARPTYAWTFGVLDEPKDDPQVNAFSTPGGYVFVSKTLLKRVHSEGQLAAVLAHEIAHVTQRHAITQYQAVKVDLCSFALKKSVVAAGVTPIASSALGSVQNTFSGVLSAPGLRLDLDSLSNAAALGELTDRVAESAFNKGYDQDKEFDADRIGAELLITAGYNPHEMITYVHGLPEGGRIFKTHPPPKKREEALNKWRDDYCAKAETLLAADCPFDGYPSVPLPADIKAIISAL